MKHLNLFYLRRHIVLLSLLMCFFVNMKAESVVVDGIEYYKSWANSSYHYEVDGYTSEIPSDVVILSSIESIPVTKIRNEAFKNCTKMESITIPASVEKIGECDNRDRRSSFSGCTSLRIIKIEDSNSALNIDYADNQFLDAPLDELYIGRNVALSFYGIRNYNYIRIFPSSLSKVTIGSDVTELDDYLFCNTSISIVTLPNVKNIGSRTFKECQKLTTVNFGDKLETIGYGAFVSCSNITKLTLPDALKTIESTAFEGCTSITEATLGKGVTSIGGSAFENCYSLTGIILPDNCTTMGDYAFYGCRKLTVAKLGKSLTRIPISAFHNCIALSEINVPASVTSIGSLAFCNDSTLATLTMEEGLKTIGSEVFYNNSGLVQMQIPSTVTSMGQNCFYGCTHIAYLTFRDGTEPLVIDNKESKSCQFFWSNLSCAYNYFYDCPIRFLYIGRDITYEYSNSVTVNGERYQHSAPFANKNSIVSVTFGPKVTMAYHNLLYGCNKISKLTFPSGFHTAYTYSLAACTGLKDIVFPETLTMLDENACAGDTSLTNVTFKDAPHGEKELTIDSWVFADCTSLKELIFPERLVELGDYACRNNQSLSSVVFKEAAGNNLSFTIGEYAFENCPSLTSMTFPAKTTSIGDYCFNKTANLKEITFTDNPKAISLGSSVSLFAPSRLQKLYMGRNMDYSVNSRYPERTPFYNQNELTDVSFSQAGTVTYCKDYLLYKADHCKTLTLPQSLQSIGKYAFSEMLALESIIVPGKVETIGDFAFAKCTSMQSSVVTADGATTIGNNVFANCTSMQSATIVAKGKTTLGNSVFIDCTSLKNAHLGDGVTETGTYIFKNDSSLVSVKLSASCPWLKEGLFYHCDALPAITIPAAVTKMDTKMFAYCSSLKEVTFEDDKELLTMGYGASDSGNGLFRDCPVEKLNLGRWLSYDTGSPSHAPFYSITTLKDIVFGQHVGLVDKYMFSYCTGLEEVYLPDNITSVGLWGFRGCTALKTVRLSEKLSQISDYGFSECAVLDNVVFPSSMTSVSDNSFSNCTALKKLDLGNSLNIIGPSAFKGCTALEGIRIPDALYALGVEAFSGCTSLPNVTIRSITSVGKQAFQGCTGIQWVALSEKTTSLGENSFDGCTGIKYVKSYATLPPEGLVNFPQSVVENGTIFVPEGSEDYYRYSPTWENWFSVHPITDNILVSAVTLDKNEISFKASETMQLTATVTGDGATDTGVLWRSSNEDVATVDANGLVTAVGVGEAEITALASDGSGQRDVCRVEVVPTMVESIEIQGGASLKKNHKMELTVAVLPATVTNGTVRWTSSNNALATVEDDGTVTAYAAGDVTITATATDGSGVSGTFALSIVPPMKGDSNDNDAVTITDAVNTANYAVGNEVENFCFEAADANGDNRITLADASSTVSIVLNQPVLAAMSRARARDYADNTDADNIVVDNFSMKSGSPEDIFVRMDNTVEYVALQADVILPDGMTLENISMGASCANHSLMTKRINGNMVRVAVFSLDNTAFLENGEPLLALTVKSDNVNCGDIVVENIIASDSKAHEYRLGAIGGHNESATGIDNVNTCDIKIEAGAKGVTIYNAVDKFVTIHNAAGLAVVNEIAKSDEEHFALTAGVYIINVGGKVVKVMVK